MWRRSLPRPAAPACTCCTSSAAPYLPESGSNSVNVEAALAQGTRLSSVLHEWEAMLKAQGFDRSAIKVQPVSTEVILQRTRG